MKLSEIVRPGFTLRLPRFDVTLRLPAATRLRLITTSVLASGFTALWIASPALLPYSDVTGRLVLAGFEIPFGVGYVTLLLAEMRIKKDLRPAATRDAAEAEQEEAEARLALAWQDRAGHVVIEGEVLPR